MLSRPTLLPAAAQIARPMASGGEGEREGEIEMCNYEETITLKTDEEAGSITVTLDAYGLWDTLPEDAKELVIRDSEYWRIIKESLEHNLGRSLSTPHFNNSIHKLREMICTDSEFVNEITVTFVKQILEEWARAEQKERKARQAFWKLYHQVKDRERGYGDDWLKIVCPSDIINEGDGYLRVSSDEVRSEIMDKFSILLREQAEGDQDNV